MESTFSIEKFSCFAVGFRWKDQDASRARIFSWSALGLLKWFLIDYFDQFSACTVQTCTVEIYFLCSIAITFQPASNESACTVSLSLAVFVKRYLSHFNSDFGAVKTKIGQLNQQNPFPYSYLSQPPTNDSSFYGSNLKTLTLGLLQDYFQTNSIQLSLNSISTQTLSLALLSPSLFFLFSDLSALTFINFC